MPDNETEELMERVRKVGEAAMRAEIAKIRGEQLQEDKPVGNWAGKAVANDTIGSNGKTQQRTVVAGGNNRDSRI
jgi:hypothetical protein